MPSKSEESVVLNETIIKLITEATELVFRTVLNEEIQPHSESPESLKPFVVAIVGLAGAGGGNLSILFDSDTAIKLAATMLGMKAEEVSTDDMRDAIGELANMIAGNLKTKLTSTLPNLVLSIPTVITGDNYQIKHLSHGPNIHVPFRVSSSPVLVQYVFNNK